MSELKHYIGPDPTNHTLTEYYLKSEADKVIADLEEKLKVQTSIAEEGWKESGTYHTSYAEAVKELYDKNKEIAKLNERIADGDRDFEMANNQNERLLKIVRHHKYKRCLAMAYVEWLKQMNLCKYPESILYRSAVRRERKWKELAEKFKEAK